MKTETVKIETIQFDPANARRHGEKNLAAIKSSLARFGQQKPIVVDANGVCRAGNGTLAAAKALGWKEVAIVRSPLSGAEATAYAIADNRSAELAEWDDDVLAQTLAALQIEDEELAVATGFDMKDIEALTAPTEVEEDEVPEPPSEPITKTGDLWILGEHRLLCGDSTKAEDVERLMAGAKAAVVLTDPPYGINLDTDYSSITGSKNSMMNRRGAKRVLANTYERVEGDDKPFDASMLSHALADAAEQFWFGANYYRRTLPGNDLDGSWLVWDKRPSALKAGGEAIDDVIGSGFELIWSKRKHQQRLLRFQWSGFTARNKEFARAHPTEKPVGLLVDILSRWGKGSNGVVVDPFLGSGTTLIAAEQLGRKCYGMEISPAYCDVIVKRWETLTGKKATRG